MPARARAGERSKIPLTFAYFAQSEGGHPLKGFNHALAHTGNQAGKMLGLAGNSIIMKTYPLGRKLEDPAQEGQNRKDKFKVPGAGLGMILAALD